MIYDKIETEYLRNLFLVLKFIGDKAMVFENWDKIFNFEVEIIHDSSPGILFQALYFYIKTQIDMTNEDMEKPSRRLPKEILEILKSIPPILMEDFKQAGWEAGWIKGFAEGYAEGYKEGKTEEIKASTLKTIRKFPDWSDKEVADFLEATVAYVRGVRKELNA